MVQQGTRIEEKLPFIRKLAYGVAYIGNSSLSGIALGGAVTFFYNAKMGLEPYWTSLAWLIFAFWNAINDPLIGIIQDRTKSRWGRRIPYLRFGAPFYSLAFVFMWFPFGSATQQGLLFSSFLLNLFIFDTFYSMIGLVTYGLAAEMAVTTKARSNLIMVGGIIGAMGSVISLALPMVLLTEDGVHPAFRPAMIGLAVFSMGCLIWASYYLKENKYTQKEEALPFFKSISESLKNKPFLIFEGATFFYIIAQTIIFTGLYYFTEYVQDLGGIQSSIPLLLIYGFTLAFTLVWNKLNQKFGLKKIFMVGLIICSISGVLVFFTGEFFFLSMITLVIFGIGFGALSLNQGSLNADVIDNDELLTGKRRETTYSGMNALITKPAISIANALFLWIIHLFGFPKNIEAIPDPVAYFNLVEITSGISVKTGIMVGFTLVPAAAFIIALIFMIFFPLDGPEWKKKKKMIKEIHLKKEAEYLKLISQERNTIQPERDPS